MTAPHANGDSHASPPDDRSEQVLGILEAYMADLERGVRPIGL